MKRTLQVIGFFMAWLALTLIAAYLWLHNPTAVPGFPKSFWLWADSLYGSTNAEEVADMELLVVFTVSGIGIAALMALVSYAASRREHPAKAVPGQGSTSVK